MTLKQNEALKEEAENFLYVDFRESAWFFGEKMAAARGRHQARTNA